MQKIYFFVKLALFLCLAFPKLSYGQCSALNATYTSYESRCAATGSIKVNPLDGSGSYKYKTIGPVNSNYTTSDSITGLSAGTYTVLVNDIVTNCIYTINNVVVNGTYQDPRFTISKTDVSCDNGNNGGISLDGQQFGRSPFTYTIVAPSPAGIGTSNNTGLFTDLIAGDYRIKMTDSCGGIQTRGITIDDYTWKIDSASFTKTSCDSASGFIEVTDSKGNISTSGGIPGFEYGAVKSPGDTIWSTDPTFQLYLTTQPFVVLIAKDNCGKIKSINVSLTFQPAVSASVNIFNKNCNTFSVSLGNVTNYFNPLYCLYDSNNVVVGCNTTGVFNNLTYGHYCINVHDSCTDTTITRCFDAHPPPLSVNANVVISNKNCTDFTAGITGQIGLINPDYCLYSDANIQLACNTTGTFNNLTYGSYCIETKDGCRDTTIVRCFTIYKPIPLIPSVIIPSFYNCDSFGIVVTADSLYHPRFCLYDSTDMAIVCNNTGVFGGLPLGTYCVNIYDSCLDTTIIRCFRAGNPFVTNDIQTNISKKNCTGFKLTIQSNITSAINHCLYDSADVLIICSSTGIFNQLPYGSYCVKSHVLCPDTVFIKCFTVSQLVPSVNNTVTISNKTCTTFKAEITNQQNLTSPQFCIYDSSDVLLRCNTTGIFDTLSYGSYCIKVVNSCFDTTIIRCFSRYADPVSITAKSSKSCSYGFAKISVTVITGTLPVNVKIYNPYGILFYDGNYNSNNIVFDSVPGIFAGQTYKVVVTDICGKADSINISSVASYANHTPEVIAQCPSAMWANGSGRIVITTSSNMGKFTVRIIKKNGLNISPQLSPNTALNNIFTYNDLEPATYIIKYKLNDACNVSLYDTVTVQPYTYPNLSRSSAYQCNVSGFSVGAVAANGVGPFSYEIISSTPSTPSITAGPQANPIFNINNGSNYSLIRLRALDACGNATLGDASILPLASYGIEVTSNCFQTSTLLSVDTIYNSTYEWFKKDSMNSMDSIFLGNGYSQFIPYFTPADTGIYICHIMVNSGCVSRAYYYNLNGSCFNILPVHLKNFTGMYIAEKVALNWDTYGEHDLNNFVIEREISNNGFVEIGKKIAKGNSTAVQNYEFLDISPATGNNFYRLKLINKNNSFSYSNVVLINKKQTFNHLTIYPNPARDALTVAFTSKQKHIYKVSILNTSSQVLGRYTYNSRDSDRLVIVRNKFIIDGLYIIRCTDLTTNEEFFEKVIFR